MPTNKQTDSKPQPETGQDVDRIRDIIFGSQIRDYERRFETFQRDVERLQQELDRLTEQTVEQDNKQSSKLQGLRREMRESDDHLRSELRQTTDQLITDKVDRASLGDLFIELGNQLKTGGSLSNLLQGLEEKE